MPLSTKQIAYVDAYLARIPTRYDREATLGHVERVMSERPAPELLARFPQDERSLDATSIELQAPCYSEDALSEEALRTLELLANEAFWTERLLRVRGEVEDHYGYEVIDREWESTHLDPEVIAASIRYALMTSAD